MADAVRAGVGVEKQGEMMDTSIFREYDIRGIFGRNLTQEVVVGIGVELGKMMAKTAEFVCVGYDARASAGALFEWLASGLSAGDVEVLDLGLIPTPVAYFACFNEIEGHKARHSIMITGSHNPKEYNGFKITLDRAPFYGADIQALKDQLLCAKYAFVPLKSSPKKLNALQAYGAYLADAFKHLKNFSHKIALDFGNGVGALGLEPVLRALGVEFESLYGEPDGEFPNHHPDPSEAKNLCDLQGLMRAKNLGVRFAFDGDADRIAMLTTKRIYAGDELAILFAQHLHAQGIAPFVIGEVKCSQIGRAHV